ncbi:MAG: PTPDL family protein [Verrucomicrobiales bacterium]
MISWNPSTTVSLLVLSIATLSADTLKLKNGTVLEGKIVQETPESIQFEYNISKSIKDIKTISRADIKIIDKEDADEIALNEIKKILPTANLLTADDYDKILAGKPADFMANFKTSKLKALVQDVIDQLLEEKAKVEANGVKIDGNWITEEEVKIDPYNHNARILATRMKASIGNHKYFLAFTQFEKLEEKFEFSTAYTESIAAIVEALPKYEARLSQYRRNQPLRIAQREKDLKSMEDDDRIQTQAAFAAKLKLFRTLRKEAQERKERWTPVSEWDLPSISETLEEIAKETKRLTQLDLTKTRTAATMLADASKHLAANKLVAAKSRLEIAQENGANGDIVTDLAERIGTARKAALAAEAAAAAAAAAVAVAVAVENETTPPENNNPKPPKSGKHPVNPKKGKQNTDNNEPAATSNNAAGNDSEENQEEPEGLSFQLLLIILAGVLLLMTVFAKVFVKSPVKEARE